MKWAKRKRVVLETPAPEDVGNVIPSGSHFFVHIKEGESYWDTVDTIIHESVHVYQMAMEYIGEETGNEAQAYHIAAIATHLLKDLHAIHA